MNRPSVGAAFLLCASALCAQQDEFTAGIVAAKRDAVTHVYVRVEKESGGDRFGKSWFKREDEKRSGIFIDPAGLCLTHWSCVAAAFDEDGKPLDRHSVWIDRVEGEDLRAELVGRDLERDLALVRLVEERAVDFFEFAASATAPAGQPVCAMGFADGESFVVFSGVLAPAQAGVQLGTRALSADEIVLTDASIRPANDAGPLVDGAGRLLGLCHAKHFVMPKVDATPEDLAKPSFGVAVASDTIRAAIAPMLEGMVVTNGTIAQPRQSAGSDAPLAKALAKVAPAIVAVHNVEVGEIGLMDPYGRQRRKGVGSGVCVDSTGLVVTNAHLIVDDTEDVVVTFLDGTSSKADVIERHIPSNLALLRLKDTRVYPFAELGDADQAKKGEQVLAVGNPFGGTLAVTFGVVSALNRMARVGGEWMVSPGLLQVDAPVDSSNTGGAVVDRTGRVLGIVNAGSVEQKAEDVDEVKDTNIGFAIPIDRVRRRFRDDFDANAGANPTVATAPEMTDADRALRESRLTRLVEASAPSLINVYVFVEVEKPDTFDPFAEDEATVMPTGQGSGVIIDSSGLALTNWHVVDGGDAVRVRTGADVEYEAKVLSTSRIDDLALLQLELPEGQSVRAVELGDSDALPIGASVVAIGNPYGHSNTVTAGVISAKDQAIHIKGRARKFKGLLQTDAAINPGNSGGALLDHEGRLVGINSAGSNADAEAGYAIPVNYVREKFHSKLLSAEKLRSSYLGMIVVDADAGPVVRSVNRFGPAARAGFRVGDVVRKVGAAAVGNRVDFVRMTLNASAGRPLPIEIDRDGATQTIQAVPISARAWRIFRQTGIEIEEVDIADASAPVRESQIAMFRRFTGSVDGEPSVIERKAVRVVQVHPSEVEAGLDLEPGDLLMGLETSQAMFGGGESTTLNSFHAVADVVACFDKYATREDHRWPLYVFRGGDVSRTTLRIKRVD